MAARRAKGWNSPYFNRFFSAFNSFYFELTDNLHAFYAYYNPLTKVLYPNYCIALSHHVLQMDTEAGLWLGADDRLSAAIKALPYPMLTREEEVIACLSPAIKLAFTPSAFAERTGSKEAAQAKTAPFQHQTPLLPYLGESGVFFFGQLQTRQNFYCGFCCFSRFFSNPRSSSTYPPV